jgi:hypothetical protein
VRPAVTLAGAVAATAVGYVVSRAIRDAAQRTTAAPELAFLRESKAWPRTVADGCHSFARTDSVRPCEYGRLDGRGTIVLFGDSHAAQWFPPLEQAAIAHGWRLVNLTAAGCPGVAVTATFLSPSDPVCNRWREAAFRRIAAIRPELVVMTNAQFYQVSIDDEIVGLKEHAEARRQWGLGIDSTLRRLSATGAAMLVLHDTPTPGIDVPECLAKRYQSPARCSTRRAEAIDATLSTVERRSAEGAVGAVFVDLTDLMCDRTECPALRDGIVVYRDGHHLTTRFAESLEPQLTRNVEQLLARRRQPSE